MSGAAEWELEYPIIDGSSSRGGMFEPKELGAELMLQLFDKKGIAHYEPYWCEMNGHSFNLYIQKADKVPCVRFDLKEMRMYPAARGLPGKEVDPKAPIFGVVSRYHRMVLESHSQDVPPTSIFFFECNSMDERDRWLTAYFINMEWATRFSAMFYPRGTARVEYAEGVWRLKVASDNTVRYLKSSRLHVSAKIDGTVFKKGSKFASAWKTRYASLKGQCTLEYYSEKGGESLGKLNMSDGKVVLVCNDTLAPPAGASTKEKLSNLKGKIGQRRTSIAVPFEDQAATKEERQENLLWFAILSPSRVWLFRAANLEDLERWMFSMEDRCNDFKQAMLAIKTACNQAEKIYAKNPVPIKYRLHPLKPSAFPLLQRAAIPGRPMSGNYSNGDEVRVGRSISMAEQGSKRPQQAPSKSRTMDRIGQVQKKKDPELNLYDDTIDDFDDLDFDSLKQNNKAPQKPAPQKRPGKQMPTSPRKPSLPPAKKGSARDSRNKIEKLSRISDDFDDSFDDKPVRKTGSSRDEKALQNLQKQFNNLREEMRDLKAEDKKKNKQIESLKADLEEAQSKENDIDEEEVEDLRRDLKAEQKKVTKLEGQVKKLTAENERLEKNLGNSKDAEEVNEELEELKREMADMEDENGRLEQQIDDLKKQVKEASKAKGELDREKKKREVVERKLQAKEEEEEKLEEEGERLRDQVVDLEEKIADLEDQVTSAKQNAVDEKAVKTLKKEKEQHLQKIVNLEAKVNTLEDELYQTREEKAQYAKRKSFPNVSDATVRDVIKTLSDENDQLISQVMALKKAAENNGGGDADVEELKFELQNAFETLDKVTEKLRELESEKQDASAVGNGGGGGGGGGSRGGGGNPIREQQLKAEVNRLKEEKRALDATIEELRAEIVLHLQDKEELAKAFEDMQNEGMGDDDDFYEEEGDEFEEEEPEPEPEPEPVKKAPKKPAGRSKKMPEPPAKKLPKQKIVDEDPFGDDGLPDEDDSW